MVNIASHGNEITSCIVLQSRMKYAIPAVITYVTATGTIFKMPIIVRHLPETNSTTSTKLTTATVIEANPIITRSVIYIVKEEEYAKMVPAITII